MQIEYRKLSDNEISYMKFKKVSGNFFQILFECEKNGVDVVEINKALEKLVDASKFLNLFICNKKFVFGERKSKLKCVENPLSFDGYNFDDIDIFNSPLVDDLMDIYAFKGINNDYLLFKFNHSYVDGQGALYIIKMLISILNDSKIDFDLKFDSDYDYAARKGTTKFREYLWYKNKLNIQKNKSNKGICVKRIQINNNINAILPKVISILNSFYDNKQLIYLIPTSIRNKNDEMFNISNLTLPLYLRTSKRDNWNEIYLRMYQDIKNNKNLNISNITYPFITKVSDHTFVSLIKLSKAIQIKTKSFFTAGCVTNIGIIDKTSYECSEIKWKSVIGIPFYQSLFPFAIAIVENVNGIEITLVTDKEMIDDKNANNILNEIGNRLKDL